MSPSPCFGGSVTAFAGVTILDAGIPRPPQAFAPQGATRLTDGPPGWLFGYDDLTTEFGFYVVSVDEQGAQQTQYLDFVSGFDTDIEYAHDRVYGTDGTVIDVSDPTAPALIGDFGFYGLVHPAAADRVYMLSGDTLRLLDPTTLSQLDSATIEALEDDDIATDFVTADEATFAVLVGSLPGRYSLRLFDNPLR